jgi:hypothetical protein
MTEIMDPRFGWTLGRRTSCPGPEPALPEILDLASVECRAETIQQPVAPAWREHPGTRGSGVDVVLHVATIEHRLVAVHNLCIKKLLQHPVVLSDLVPNGGVVLFNMGTCASYILKCILRIY